MPATASRSPHRTPARSAPRPRPGLVHDRPRLAPWRLAVRQVENPIVLLLVGAAAVSLALGDTVDGVIILVITGASATLGFVQERGAVRAVEDLLASVRATATVRRDDGTEVAIALDEVVVGDLLVLRAGDVVAGDATVVDADGLSLDQSALTGESFPADKRPREAEDGPGGLDDPGTVWCGTHVVSGSGTAQVVTVGADTELGRIGSRLVGAHVPTAFEIGLRRFGFLLMRTTAVLVVALFAVNVALDRPMLESLLFSLALAVGLTPQLLPTIVTVTLSAGARRMARRKVIVKRLDAIEDIGAIDVLCTDKTGTLTTGEVALRHALDPFGEPSELVRTYAWVNAAGQRSFTNPIDAAVTATGAPSVAWHVHDELPYDFARRRMSVLATVDGRRCVLTKGAVESVLAVCSLDADAAAAARARFAALSAGGDRVLAVATRTIDADRDRLEAGDEADLHLDGFVVFTDPPKPDAVTALAELASLGVSTRLITGDNRHAAAHVAAAVGLDGAALVTGGDLASLHGSDFDATVEAHTVFAEIDPIQKEQIVAALRRNGHRVGYLGDGINDAPALRTADVGISVDTAVDIARHTAAIVLLQRDLGVIAEGIRQGRRVFANTIKYVQVTISANFGNMLSMAVASPLLPFLPLLPRQILLLNFLSDIPGMTIAADRVDAETVTDPHGWDLRQLRRFMIVFGLVSSAFDLLTFAVLRIVFDADAATFRTAWFIESTATELAAMLVLRTRRPLWRSRPGVALAASSAAVAMITVALPFSPLAGNFGLDRPGAATLATLAGITAGYVAATEMAKRTLGHRAA